MKSGMIFGVTLCFLIGGLLFVPIYFDHLLHACVLILISIYAKLKNLEYIGSMPLVFGIFVAFCFVPFCIFPITHANLYYDDKQILIANDASMDILICILFDFISSALIALNFVFIWKICRAIKPSQMRFMDDREPSIVEIAFFISLWASFVCILPCIICDFVFDSEEFLTANIMQTSGDKNMLHSLAEHRQFVSVGVILMMMHIFSLIACLSVMNLSSLAILYAFVVINRALFVQYYFESMLLWQLGCLLAAYFCCFGYLFFRGLGNKKLSQLTWAQYLTRTKRIESTESFTTLLTHHHKFTSIHYNQQRKRRKKKKKMYKYKRRKKSVFQIFSHPFNRWKNPENESDDESILSISVVDDDDASDERVEDVVIKSKKRLMGPNTHNNSRFGLPSHVQTPPPINHDDEDDAKMDFDFHANIIRNNVENYKKRKYKKYSRGIKSASLNGIDTASDIISCSGVDIVD